MALAYSQIGVLPERTDSRDQLLLELPGLADIPLHEVTFVVVDVETTGWDPHSDALTEVAAARFTGGLPTGTFHSLVDPGMPIPREVTALTGIDDDMVRDGPDIAVVLTSLSELIGDAVVVGHNIEFDLSFIDAARARFALSPLKNAAVDTLHLARRLVREDVLDCSLANLARRLRLDHRPSHRALEDVMATADLLHALIERATGYGVFRLRDLLSF